MFASILIATLHYLSIDHKLLLVSSAFNFLSSVLRMLYIYTIKHDHIYTFIFSSNSLHVSPQN